MSETEPVPTYASPPTAPGALGVGASRSQWPTVIGIIAIVFGAAGALINACGVLGPYLRDLAMKMVPNTPEVQSMMAVQEKYGYVLGGLAIVSMFLAIWLLVSGILLLKRRRGSAGQLKVWSVVKMVLVIVVSIVNFNMQQEIMRVVQEGMAAQGSTAPPAVGSIQNASMYAGLVFGLVWGWALPIFTLIWFNRQPIKHEVSSWA